MVLYLDGNDDIANTFEHYRKYLKFRVWEVLIVLPMAHDPYTYFHFHIRRGDANAFRAFKHVFTFIHGGEEILAVPPKSLGS